jgi:fructokinase
MIGAKSTFCGGIEAGVTKSVCSVDTSPDNLREMRFAATTPDETIERVI